MCGALLDEEEEEDAKPLPSPRAMGEPKRSPPWEVDGRPGEDGSAERARRLLEEAASRGDGEPRREDRASVRWSNRRVRSSCSKRRRRS